MSKAMLYRCSAIISILLGERRSRSARSCLRNAIQYPNDAGIAAIRALSSPTIRAWESDTAKVPPGTWDAVRNSRIPITATLVQPGNLVIGDKEVKARYTDVGLLAWQSQYCRTAPDLGITKTSKKAWCWFEKFRPLLPKARSRLSA